ncbi:MAG: hypothetical protein K0R18_64 [Bacillales bacterium]|jgi:hypothetical protein|nr:hypothetical protein [Bacillales bacterium]
MANEDFKFDTSYNPDSAFTRVKFGVNRPILETELNELQKINEERLMNFIRQNSPTGFWEIVKRDFIGAPIVYNPNGKENSIAISPARLLLNGYNVVVEGNDTVNGFSGYTIIDFGEAPDSGSSFYNFAYLELWFEELNSQSTIYKNGYIDGDALPNNLVDDRVGGETSRRVALRYKFNVKNDVDFDRWPQGFGFENISEYSPIYASGPNNVSITNHKYLFISALSPEFRNTTFYGDSGLYVAGRPDHPNTNVDFGILENYIFAIPVLSVKRRNKNTYSSSNSNGADKYINEGSLSNRPDGLFFNRIDPRDVNDLRKTVTLGQVNTTKMLDQSLKNLMNGALKTSKKETLLRSQFGVAPIESYEDTSYNNNAIFHVKFRNQNLTPTIGLVGTVDGTPEYHLAASGYGLSLDGNIEVKYPINTFYQEAGTIDFFLKPYWDGADQNISQTILSVSNETGYPLMLLKKIQGKLVLRLNYSQDETLSTYTMAYLDQNPIYNNEIYHIRLTWQSSINGSDSKIYINGNLAASGIYIHSALAPKYITLGAKNENINSYSPDFVGCVIDELVMYSKVLDNGFLQLSSDIVNGDARIHSSFNGVLSSFKDNTNTQTTITPVTTVPASTSLTLSVPYGLTIDSSSPLNVYNPQTNVSYTGTWDNFVNNTAVFTPTDPATFTGETIWVVHGVTLSGGFGIKDIPTKVLKATINNEEMSFASTMEDKRQITLVNADNTIEKEHKAFDYNSDRDARSAFARLLEYKFISNGTNIYVLPATLYGRAVIGIKKVDKPLSSVLKNANGSYEIILIEELPYNETFIVTVALGGYAFEYETYTKSPIVNTMRAATIKIPTTGNTKIYAISATGAIPGSNIVDPAGGVIVSFLGLDGYDEDYNSVDFGTNVFVTGSQFNYFANATVTGIGTPIININFVTTPQAGHFIEIPVLVSYQPRATDIISVWYDYVPYQGVLNKNIQKDLRRLTDWKIFCTTLGSGKMLVNKIKDKSINNASNRLPGGQNYSYLLDGSDIEFEGEQMTIPASYGASYSVNRKLVFRNEFTELVFNNEYDDDVNSLNTEFSISKLYGQNHQDAFISSLISEVNFCIQDTKVAINKYLGAACLVADEEGNIFLLVIGEIKTSKTKSSIIKPTHGDLFKIENNPIVVVRKY